MSSLKEAIEKIKADKVKDRDAGVEMYLQMFSQQNIFEQIYDQNDHEKRFRVIIQNLFQSVVIEKEQCLKKGGIETAMPSALKRLKAVANVVKVMMENGCKFYEKEVVKMSLAHLMQMIDHKSEVFKLISHEYVRAIKAILLHPPHVQFLDPEQWQAVATLLFNMVSGTKLKETILTLSSDFWEPSKGQDQEMASPTKARKTTTTLEVVDAMECLELLMRSTQAPLITPLRLGVFSLAKYLTFIEDFTGESSAHLAAITGLNHLLAQLEFNEREIVRAFAARAWPSLLTLWNTRKEALKEQMIITFRILLPALAYPTPFREGSAEEKAERELAPIRAAQLAQLQELILEEGTTRTGCPPLSLSSFEFAPPQDQNSARHPPFSYRSFRGGRILPASQALSWACLELASDVTAHLLKLQESDALPASAQAQSSKAVGTPSRNGAAKTAPNQVSATRSKKRTASVSSNMETLNSTGLAADSNRSAKKRRVEESMRGLLPATSAILSRIGSDGKGWTGSLNSVWCLQVLLFLVERHWKITTPALRSTIVAVIDKQILDDSELNSHGYVILAATILAQESEANFEEEMDSFWERIWNLIIRKHISGTSSRAAAHAASALLSSNLIPREVSLADLQNFISNIDVTGPLFPYDSICTFLGESIQRLSRDAVYSSSKLEEHVLLWLSLSWSPIDGTAKGFSNSRSRIESSDPTDIVYLLSQICRLPRLPRIKRTALLLPSCDVVSRVISEHELGSIRDFFWEAKVTRTTSTSSSQAVAASHSMEKQVEPRTIENIERRCSVLLEKALQDFIFRWSGGQNQSLTQKEADDLTKSCSAEQARLSLEMVSTTLLWNSILKFNYIRSDSRELTLNPLASQLLGALSPILAQSRWNASSRATILKGLETLLGLKDRSKASLIPISALCEPGIRSGVPSSARASSAEDQNEVERRDREQDEIFLQLIWQIPELENSLNQLFRAVDFSLTFVAGGSIEPDGEGEEMDLDDDGFGAVRSSASTQKSQAQEPRLRDLSFEPRAVTASVELCISILADIPRLRRGADEAESCEEVIQTVLQQELHVLEAIGPALLDAVAESRLHITQIDASAILEVLGDRMLAKHTHGRSEAAQLLTVAFLESTMNAWLHESTQGSEFTDNIENVLQYLVENVSRKNARMSWRVRIRACRFFLRYLEADPSQRFWSPDGRESISFHTPANVIVSRNGDPDSRARFSAASMSAKLAETTEERGVPLETLHATMDSFLSHRDSSGFERVATRILALGNSVVATSAARNGALKALIAIAMDYNGSDSNFPSLYDRYVRSTLQGGADRLGYKDVPSMLYQFALVIAFDLSQSEDTLLRLPYSSLGYATKKDGMRHLFKPFASVFICANVQMKSVGTVLGIITKRSLGLEASDPFSLLAQECLPLVIAQIACFSADELVGRVSFSLQDRKKEWNTELKLLSERFESNSFDLDLEELLPGLRDQIIVYILSLCTELKEDAQMSILQHLNNSESISAAKAFKKMSTRLQSEDLRLFSHPPPLPCFLPSSTCEALKLLEAGGLEVFSESTAYHVIRQMLSLILSTRQLNEQVRLVEALKLYVSICSEIIGKNQVLLSIIIRGATSLLGQVDLAEFAWGLVEWCFDSACQLAGPLSALGASSLQSIQISEFYQSSKNVEERKLGIALEQCLVSSLKTLLETGGSTSIVTNAIRAWPKQILADLREIIGEPDLEDLISALQSISTAKLSSAILLRFRIAIRSLSPEQKQAFASDTIWRLLERLPENNLLNEDQSQRSAELASALADLFHLCHGHLRAPEVQTLNQIWDKSDDRPEVSHKSDNHLEQTGHIKTFLIRCLLKMEAREGLLDSDRTFKCLRAILSHDSQLSDTHFWPKGMTEELRMLSSFSSPLTPAKFRSPQTLERQDSVDKAHSFSGWISFFTTYICDLLANLIYSGENEGGLIYAQFSPLVESEPALSKQLCPSLLHALLLEDSSAELERYAAVITSYFTKILDDPDVDPQVWACIIEAVLHLRYHSPPKGAFAASPLGSDRWLELDFLKLSRRALDCKQYTTSLLFVELCKEHELETNKGSDVSSLLYEAYSSVDDPDGFYGIQNSDLRSSLLQRLHHEGEWNKAFELHASYFESATAVPIDAAPLSSGYVNRSLHELGFNRLAASLGMTRSTGSHHSKEEIAFDVAWRTGSWDAISGGDFNPGTSQGLFSALRSLHRELDQKVADTHISSALISELNGLRGLGIEASAAVRRISSDLMCLNEARAWRTKMVDLKEGGEAISSLRPIWPTLSESFEFGNFERILMTRQSILQSERQRHEVDQIGDMADSITTDATKLERSLLLKLSSGARNQGRLQNSINAVTLAQRLDDHLGSSKDSALVTEEFANVLWELGHHAIAIQALDLLRTQLASAQPGSTNNRVPAVLATLGQWHATARSQPPGKIDSEYFSKAHAMLSENSDPASRAHVCYRYATFADEQYRSLCNLPEIAQLRVFISQREREVSEHERLGTRSNNPHLKAAQEALTIDGVKVKEHERIQQLFLVQSTNMYAEALEHSDLYNDKVMRFVALWFENSENLGLNKELPNILAIIPSHKLITLTHQLSSRLSNGSGSGSGSTGSHSPSSMFQSNLTTLMRRMCEDHPFHLLFTIYALKNGFSDSETMSTPSLVSTSDRANAAMALWNHVLMHKPHQKKVKNAEMVCNAAVEWARYPLGNFEGRSRKVDGKYAWSGFGLKLENLVNVEVPVLTSPLPINPACSYTMGNDFVGISRYQPGFAVAGGVHRPKISVCLGTDGKNYKQLFKSEDDLRQDAVFQQVFRLVNNLLRDDRRARQRLLKIRTYVVMPLGPQDGLLEFVGNTQAIAEPLLAMHALHEPSVDIQKMKSKLRATEQQRPVDYRRKIGVYKHVCTQIQPVFRHYFWGTQKLPSAWFAMRLNYTRSVATNSIVGHLLGLGDRHVSNILLDTSTGEVIHIDFGVAFDQGKLLPIQEKVPFRLTRDFVDGMGISGVEGTFRRSCEETLRVLREGKDIIQTVLDVLKYDPLFTWTSNPVQLNQIQSTDAPVSRKASSKGKKSIDPSPGRGQQAQGTAELVAEQAITTIMTKLSPTLRIESTVNELIEQARDENALGSIYSGWSPYL